MARRVNWPFVAGAGLAATAVCAVWWIWVVPREGEFVIAVMIATAALAAALASRSVARERVTAAAVRTWLIFSVAIWPILLIALALVYGVPRTLPPDGIVLRLAASWPYSFVVSTLIALPVSLLGAAIYIGLRAALRRICAA